MKKLLTYVLWSSTKYTKQPSQRYWHNIPYLLVVNSCLFPDFHTRYYIHKDSINHPFFVFLREASRKFEKVEVEILDIPYKGTQLTIQRMKPLWEEDIDYLFCRDTDYAITGLERKCMDHFMEQDQCSIHSIRARRSHSYNPLYAGLCGFNVKKLSKNLKSLASTFDEYIKFGCRNVSFYKNGDWECDQFLLRDFFCHSRLHEMILDCPLQNASLKVTSRKNWPKRSTYTPILCRETEYIDRKGIGCDITLLNLLKQLFVSPSLWNTFEPFVGRGWTCSSKNLRRLIHHVDNNMSKTVEKIFKDSFGDISYKVDNSGICKDERV